MRGLALLFAMSTFLSPVTSWGQEVSTKIFSAATAPTGCQIIAGLFPVGDRTDLIWGYERYAVVMPPYKKKTAQSLECGGQKGTLYFFDYRSEADKEHALLFSKPVLAKQGGVSHALPIREWATGFVIVSFTETPPEILTALDERLNGKAPASPPATVAVKSAHEAWAPVPASEPVTRKANPSAVIPPPALPHRAIPPAAAQPTAPVTKAVEGARTVSKSTVSVEPFSQLKPSITAQPFESHEASKFVQPSPKLPEPPRVVVKEAIHERPPRRPQMAPVVAKSIAAPPTGTTDLSSSVLESYASKMGCESTERNSQTQTVCALLQEFASGLPPDLPLKTDSILMGPVYSVDANGRFTDLHYDGVAGTRERDVVSLFSFPSSGGKDDYEIKQLVEARKTKVSLPTNDMTARLPALIAAKHFGLRKSNGRSAVLQPAPERRLFIRRAGDHLIAIGTASTAMGALPNATLTVGVFY